MIPPGPVIGSGLLMWAIGVVGWGWGVCGCGIGFDVKLVSGGCC